MKVPNASGHTDSVSHEHETLLLEYYIVNLKGDEHKQSYYEVTDPKHAHIELSMF